jgi:hypothetical protein
MTETAPAPAAADLILTPAEYFATGEKLAKINARAEKRGFTGRVEITGERFEKTYKTPAGLPATEVLYRVRITGEAPSYGGYRFLATLDWSEAGLIVRTAPGVESVDRDGLTEGWCDHCRTQRSRKEVYLVANEAGEQLQIGSTCIKDFLGWDGRPVFYSESEVRDELDEFLGGFGGGRTFTPHTVLAAAWAATTRFGFVPASAQFGQPTKDVVLALLDPHSNGDRELAAELGSEVAEAAAMATKIQAFLLSDEFGGTSEYVTNLKTLAAAEVVETRHIGFLASAPQAWAKAQERSLVRQREAGELLNEHVGAPKQRLELSLRVKAVRFIEGNYGVTTLYTMADAEGHVFKWFSSSQALGEEASEEFVRIKGTVKAHEEYQGTKSTMLTRCALL